MKYCKKCVQPDTRPGIYFSEDGICGACLWEEEKKRIDWNAREEEMKKISREAQKRKTGAYDCAIGVSGGKDSTFQAVYAKEKLGLKALLVHCEPFHRTEIGSYNLENLKRLGFDVISIRPNPIVLKKLMIKDFYKYLNPIKVTEYALWASTYIIADKFDIPLIIQGENPGQTLGVSKMTGTDGNALNAKLQNTIKEDPFTEYLNDDITAGDLFLYGYDKKRLEEKGIKGIWLSNYAKEWSQPHNAIFSMDRGMKIRQENINPYEMGTYRRFSQLDTGGLLEVNQMFKYIKFGFGQTTDHACYDIRDRLITRGEGIFLTKELDGKCGQKQIDDFCDFIGIDEKAFWKHANQFRGAMWEQGRQGEWKLKDPIWEQSAEIQDYSIAQIQKRLGM